MQRDDRYRMQYQAVELDPDERLSECWRAKVAVAGGNSGWLWLTSQRLLFDAMKTPAKPLSWVLKNLGATPVGEVVEAAGNLDQMRSWSASLADIERVDKEEATPPGLRVVLRSGDSRAFAITADMWSFRWSSNNEPERDRAQATITAALGAPLIPPTPVFQPQAPSSVGLPGSWSFQLDGEEFANLTLREDGIVEGTCEFFGGTPGLFTEGRWWLMGGSDGPPTIAFQIRAEVDQEYIPLDFFFRVDESADDRILGASSFIWALEEYVPHVMVRVA